MVIKKVCDVCGTEIPYTLSLIHNEASEIWQGHFLRENGIVIVVNYDLCDGCSKKVSNFIEGLMVKAIG